MVVFDIIYGYILTWIDLQTKGSYQKEIEDTYKNYPILMSIIICIIGQMVEEIVFRGNDIAMVDVIVEEVHDKALIDSFRIIDKEDPFYDILINLKAQINNHLFLHSFIYSLCRFNDQSLIDEITPINNEYDDEEKLLCVIKALNHQKKTKQQLESIEGLPPINYMLNTVFQSTINANYIEVIY